MFFNKYNEKDKEIELAKVTALLVYAAKIDQDFSSNEENIIKKTIIEIGAKEENIERIMLLGREMESNSNQILDFTKKVKNMNEKDKIKIIESLWKIIYSNKEVDIYESNLMRRLAGLLYIDSKLMGDIKEKVKKESSK